MTLAGLVLAAALAIGGIALPRGQTLWHLVAAPEEDGGWRFVTIDGVDVTADRYALGVHWGKITGFDDGCNSCGYSDDKPSGARDRMMTCTLVKCEPKPHDLLFHRFASGDPKMTVRDQRLILTLPGHQAELVRTSPES